MARERWIEIDRPSEWRAALTGIAHSSGHTWEYCKAMQAHSGLPTFLYELETATGRYVCPVQERTFGDTTDIVTPHGLSGFVGVGNMQGVEHYWRRSAQRRRYVCGFLVSNPALHNAVPLASADTYRNKDIFVLDLTRPQHELEAGLPPKRRHELRRWEAGAETLSTDRERMTRFFLDNQGDFFSRRGANCNHRLSSASIVALAAADHVIMVGVDDGGELTAASMFAYTPSGADYLYNVSKPHGRARSAVLIWWAVQRLRSMGVPQLNLGGGLVAGDGIARFKAKFGATKLALPVVKQVYDWPKYSELCRRAGADPKDMRAYFPAYRKPEAPSPLTARG